MVLLKNIASGVRGRMLVVEGPSSDVLCVFQGSKRHLGNLVLKGN